MGVASPAQARQAQISRFLLVLGTEDVLALSKDTIGTAWASRVFFRKNCYSNGFFEFTLTNFWAMAPTFDRLLQYNIKPTWKIVVQN